MVANNGEKSNSCGNMPQRTRFKVRNVSVADILAELTKFQREKLISGYDLKNFAKLFEDEDTMATVECYFNCGMNVSETSRRMYMHRNTLIYRLKKIQKLTGLDISRFDMAVTFEVLRTLYKLK